MIDFIVNVISCATINFLLLKQLSKKYSERKIRYSVLLFFVVSILVALINMLSIPIFNMLGTLMGYLILKVILYGISVREDIGKDIINFFILVFIDSICYFLTGFIYPDPQGIEFFKPFTSSLIVMFTATILFNCFLYSKIERVPKYEIILFLIVTLFSVGMIYLISINYMKVNNTYKSLIIMIVIGIVVINMIFFHYLEYISKHYKMKEQLMHEEIYKQLKSEYYRNLNDQYINTRKLIHDFKNHMYALSIAYKQGKIESAEKIMEQFNKECDETRMKYMTGSDILDIILNDKSAEAEKKYIRFDFKMEELKLDWISEFDMITIFGNLLDNAIEANEGLEEKRIDVRIYEQHTMVVISIKNTCRNELNLKNRKIRSTKENHKGLGIESVKGVVKKHNGEFDIEIKDGICTVLLYLIRKINHFD